MIMIIKGATLSDVSICNIRKPIFKDQRSNKARDDGRVKRFVLNSRGMYPYT